MRTLPLTLLGTGLAALAAVPALSPPPAPPAGPPGLQTAAFGGPPTGFTPPPPPPEAGGGYSARQLPGQRFEIRGRLPAGSRQVITYAGAAVGLGLPDAAGDCVGVYSVPVPGAVTATTSGGTTTFVLANAPPRLTGVAARWDPASGRVAVTGTVLDEAPAGAWVTPQGGYPAVVAADGRFTAFLPAGRRPAAVVVTGWDWYGLTDSVSVPVQ